ncbi:solute carrier family 66 member 3 isoform X1 [Dromaius novaehollandiae]|uniref:solute carrier family 66 member 3 isoform X1 n=1 Tax=Dromaius novaehollandiae TaxID=8790 RepID=UPI00311F8898
MEARPAAAAGKACAGAQERGGPRAPPGLPRPGRRRPGRSTTAPSGPAGPRRARPRCAAPAPRPSPRRGAVPPRRGFPIPGWPRSRSAAQHHGAGAAGPGQLEHLGGVRRDQAAAAGGGAGGQVGARRQRGQPRAGADRLPCVSEVPDLLWLPSADLPGISYHHCTSGNTKQALLYAVIFVGGWYMLTLQKWILDLAMNLCTLISAASKLAQLRCLWQTKDSGQVSALTWSMSAYTCATRIITTLMTTNDLIVLIRFIIMLILNIWVTGTILHYRKTKKTD